MEEIQGLFLVNYIFNLNTFFKHLYFRDSANCLNRIVITPKPRLMADSRSTGRLQSSNAHRSMTRLNAGERKF